MNSLLMCGWNLIPKVGMVYEIRYFQITVFAPGIRIKEGSGSIFNSRFIRYTIRINLLYGNKTINNIYAINLRRIL